MERSTRRCSHGPSCWLLVGVVAVCSCAGSSGKTRSADINGKENIYPALSSGTLERAKALLRDDWDLGPREPVAHLPTPLSWTEDPFHDHYWKFIFYSLRPLSNLVYAYYTTHDPAYRDKLIQILRSFTDIDPIRAPNSDTFEYRHAAAFRAMMLVNVYGKLTRSGDMPSDLEPKLRASIQRVGDFLRDPYNFESKDNHAFNEAAGLLAIGANFPDLPNGPMWTQTAIDRLMFEMQTTVDADGVEVENSPFYHFYVLSSVMQVHEWAVKFGVPVPEELGGRVQSMLKYATLIAQPDGKLPLLGSTVALDVRKLAPIVYDEEDISSLPNGLLSDELFTFIRTAGAHGTEPTDRNVAFRASGQGILRSAFGRPDVFGDQTHITFFSGRWNNNHTHHDTLGINLFSSGRLLLADSGLDTYDHGAEHDYFWSTRAHNTVVVDGIDQGMDPNAMVRTGLVASGAAPGTWAYQSGAHALYPGVNHKRSVVLLQKDLVLVIDALSSDSSHEYAQTWHLGPDIKADIQGFDVTGRSASGDALILLHQAMTHGAAPNAVYGQDAPMQGYFSTEYHVKEPNWVVEYKSVGENSSFVTLLASGRYAGIVPTVAAQLTAGSAHAIVCAGDASYVVDVTNQADQGEAVVVSWDATHCASSQ